MDVEAALKEVATEIAEAEGEIAKQQERLSRLREEERGLQLFLARHRGDTVPSHGPATARNPWVAMSRTDAILRVMEATTEAMSPGDIARALTNQGRTGDTTKNVSGALSYLQKQDKVRSLGRGRWVLALPPLQPLSAAIVAANEGPAMKDIKGRLATVATTALMGLTEGGTSGAAFDARPRFSPEPQPAGDVDASVVQGRTEGHGIAGDPQGRGWCRSE